MRFGNSDNDPLAADTASAVTRALRHAAVKDDHYRRRQIETIRAAIAALEAAAQGVDAVSAMIGEARELAQSAAATQSQAKRALIAERFNDVIESVDGAVQRSGADGVNLIDDGKDEIEIDLEHIGGARLAVRHTRLTRGIGGLILSPVENAFSEDAEIARAQAELDRAATRVEGLAERFCADAAFLSDRLPEEAA